MISIKLKVCSEILYIVHYTMIFFDFIGFDFMYNRYSEYFTKMIRFLTKHFIIIQHFINACHNTFDPHILLKLVYIFFCVFKLVFE